MVFSSVVLCSHKYLKLKLLQHAFEGGDGTAWWGSVGNWGEPWYLGKINTNDTDYLWAEHHQCWHYDHLQTITHKQLRLDIYKTVSHPVGYNYNYRWTKWHKSLEQMWLCLYPNSGSFPTTYDDSLCEAVDSLTPVTADVNIRECVSLYSVYIGTQGDVLVKVTWSKCLTWTIASQHVISCTVWGISTHLQLTTTWIHFHFGTYQLLQNFLELFCSLQYRPRLMLTRNTST